MGKVGNKVHEDFILRLREDYLKGYMSDLVKKAEWLVKDLKMSQEHLNNEKYIKNTKIEDIVREAVDRATSFNPNAGNGADVIAEYVEAKVRKELAEKREEDQKLIDCLQKSLKELIKEQD